MDFSFFLPAIWFIIMYMKKGTKVIIAVMGVLAVLYAAGCFYFANHFIFNTTINGINVSLKDAETVSEAISNRTPILKIVQKDSRGEEVIEHIDLTNDCDGTMSFDVTDILNQQNRFLWFVTAITGADYQSTPVDYNYSEEKLLNQVAGLYCLQGENIIYPTDAQIVYENGELQIVNEDNGCYIDEDTVWEIVSESCNDALKMGNDITVNLTSSYATADVTAESQELQDKISEFNKILGKSVNVYVDGYLARTIEPSEVKEMLAMNNSEFYVIDEKAGEMAREIANEYYVSDYKYIDRSVLKARIITALLEDDDSTVTVNYVISVKGYVDVSISNQMLYYYENDVLVLSSPVVTGDQDDPDYYTPTGTFKVRKKDVDCVLRGEDYVENVDYWIGFDSTGTIYGLHDASWRSEFGGDIYLTDPSHGCVNMPTDKIAELYKRIPMGAEIYIHE